MPESYPPRAPIPADQLSPEQRENVEKLSGIGAAVNAVLQERGLDVQVYGIQFGPPLDVPVAVAFAEPPIVAEPEPIGLPPPGGCYCTDCDDQGRCWSYCC